MQYALLALAIPILVCCYGPSLAICTTLYLPALILPFPNDQCLRRSRPQQAATAGAYSYREAVWLIFVLIRFTSLFVSVLIFPVAIFMTPVFHRFLHHFLLEGGK